MGAFMHQSSSPARPHPSAWKRFIWLPAALILLIWLINTPPGLLGKLDAIAYAVCHRIPSHSYFFAGRQLPLCARCTGMYLGALAGLVYQFRKERRGGFPSWKIAIPFIISLVAFAVDGVNSYLHLIPGAPTAYASQNWLRLLTGSAFGLGMSVVLVPAFNQTAWADFLPSPPISNYQQIALLFVLAAALDGLVFSGYPVLLYPLALLSTGSVLLLLTLVYSMALLLIFRRENHYASWRGLTSFLVGGATLALLQITLLDYGRFWLTHTWQGFNLPG